MEETCRDREPCAGRADDGQKMVFVVVIAVVLLVANAVCIIVSMSLQEDGNSIKSLRKLYDVH